MAKGRPLFVRKVRQENPGKQIEVWFEDEARIGQQGSLTRCWAQKGTRPTAVKQTEYEWVYLFGAVNPLTGESSALLSPSVNTEYMNHHLRFISEQAGSNIHVVLIVDNAGWHSAKGLRIPQNITLFYLPAYSPELNPIERLWSYLKSHFLSNRAYCDYNDLFSACRDAWNQLTSQQFCSICQTEWLLHEK